MGRRETWPIGLRRRRGRTGASNAASRHRGRCSRVAVTGSPDLNSRVHPSFVRSGQAAEWRTLAGTAAVEHPMTKTDVRS
jgi:hypothetical protein